jgi:uncharacterized protein (TIRG00374 family)
MNRLIVILSDPQRILISFNRFFGELMKAFRNILFTVLKIVVTVGIILLLIGKLGWDDILTTIKKAQCIWLLPAFFIFLFSGWLGVIQWQILLKNRGIQLTFGRAFRLYFIGMFFNNFVMGGIVGDAVKVASIKTDGGKGRKGLAATFLDRFAGLWAMCGFAVIGSGILLVQKGELINGKIGTAVIALFVTFIMFAGIMTFLMHKPLQNFFFKCYDVIPFIKNSKIKDIISEMLIEAHDYHILVSVSLFSFFIQMLRIGVHLFAAVSLGLLTAANFQYFLIFVPIIAMLMTIPLPFGVREAAGGALFTFAGFPPEESFVMGFLATLVGLAASFLGAIFFIAEKNILRSKKNAQNIDCRTAIQ